MALIRLTGMNAGEQVAAGPDYRIARAIWRALCGEPTASFGEQLLLSPAPSLDLSLASKRLLPRTVPFGVDDGDRPPLRRVGASASVVVGRLTRDRTRRATYKDFGLVFAKEWGRRPYSRRLHRAAVAGEQPRATRVREVIKASEVRAIKFHSLRHTCATLLLQAGQPVHVVSERLGHAKVSVTMEVYAHVLPDMQQEAARSLGGILHG